MGFSQNIKEQILVDSARHCCVCHKSKGLNIEVHHIRPQKQGGEDTYENAIALCFDCHADAGHYFASHPKGLKLSPSELMKHKKNWLETVKNNKIEIPNESQIDLLVINNSESFHPEFIEEKTKFLDRNKYKQMYKLLKLDYKDMLNQLKTGNKFVDYKLEKIKTLDDYIDYINGDEDIEACDYRNDELNIQPSDYALGINTNGFGLSKYRTTNQSICMIKLKLLNSGPDVLEDFKIYLDFENVIKADTVDKRKDELDFFKYKYNVHFMDNNNAEFIPNEPILVQNDFIVLDPICFLTKHIENVVTLHWKLVARGFNKSGQIQLSIKPKIEVMEFMKFVDDAENYEPKTVIRFKYK